MKNFLAGFGCATMLWVAIYFLDVNKEPAVPVKNIQQTLRYLEMDEHAQVSSKLRNLNLNSSDPERINAVFDSLARVYEQSIAGGSK